MFISKAAKAWSSQIEADVILHADVSDASVIYLFILPRRTKHPKITDNDTLVGKKSRLA